jgi:hypothetical protein
VFKRRRDNKIQSDVILKGDDGLAATAKSDQRSHDWAAGKLAYQSHAGIAYRVVPVRLRLTSEA